MRLTTFDTVSTALALHSSAALRSLVDGSPAMGIGIGGSSALVEVEGTPVFAKSVALTDLESAHFMSTANLFGVPAFCHYGIGSPGISAWRELAAHTMTTNWVLSGRSESFPLMYHWRVLPGAPALSDEPVDPDYWGGSPAVRARLDAVAQASSRIVLFLEFVPQSLHDWLSSRSSSPDAIAFVERELRANVPFPGLLHFDAHFRNILTDGTRLYFTDFGLATSPSFELSTEERRFIALNADHDRAYVLNQLYAWLMTDLTGSADGPAPPVIAELAARYRSLRSVMGPFYAALRTRSRETPFPAADVSRCLNDLQRASAPQRRSSAG